MSNISSQSSYFIFSDKVHKLSIILNNLDLKRSVNSRLFHHPHFILKKSYPLFEIFILSHQSMMINNIYKLFSLFKQSNIDYVIFQFFLYCNHSINYLTKKSQSTHNNRKPIFLNSNTQILTILFSNAFSIFFFCILITG